jgi:hypothetical protein
MLTACEDCACGCRWSAAILVRGLLLALIGVCMLSPLRSGSRERRWGSRQGCMAGCNASCWCGAGAGASLCGSKAVCAHRRCCVPAAVQGASQCSLVLGCRSRWGRVTGCGRVGARSCGGGCCRCNCGAGAFGGGGGGGAGRVTRSHGRAGAEARSLVSQCVRERCRCTCVAPVSCASVMFKTAWWVAQGRTPHNHQSPTPALR